MKKPIMTVCGLAVACTTPWLGRTGAVWPANGHYYDAILFNGTWFEARQDAIARGGDLATLTDLTENAFVFSLVETNPAFWFNDAAGNTQGPWIGGLQRVFPPPTEPDGHWLWVSGEPWAYENWASGEPNNSGGNENWLQLFGTGRDNPAPTWNDITPDSPVQGYILEVIPEPRATAVVGGLLLSLGVLGRHGILYRHRQAGEE